MNDIVISTFKESGLEKFILEDYKRSLQEITDTVSEIGQLEEDKVPQKLKDKLKEQKKKVQDILTGKKSEYYTAMASMMLNKQVKNLFDGMSFNTFVENYFGKKVSELSPNENDEFSM
jgi:hypothetical protein